MLNVHRYGNVRKSEHPCFLVQLSGLIVVGLVRYHESLREIGSRNATFSLLDILFRMSRFSCSQLAHPSRILLINVLRVRLA